LHSKCFNHLRHWCHNPGDHERQYIRSNFQILSFISLFSQIDLLTHLPI
jgi:hypothetical protein